MTVANLINNSILRTLRSGLTLPLRFRNLNMRQKLSGLASIPVVVVALFIYAYFPRQLEEEAINSIASKAESIADMSVYALGPALDFGQLDEIRSGLEAAIRFDDVVYSYVQDKSGNFVYTFEREVQDNAHIVLSKRTGLGPYRQTYHIAKPIFIRDQHVGYLYLGFSLDAIAKSMMWSRMVILAFSILILVLGIIAAMIIGSYVTKPMGEIVGVAKTIARGELSSRVNIDSDDEIGILGSAFNEMLDSLEMAHESITNSEGRFRAVIEHSSDIIAIVDVNGLLQYVSPSSTSVIGYEPDELVNTTLFQHVRSRDHSILRLGLERGAARRGQFLTAEVEWRHKDGRWLNLAFRGKNLLDYPGVNGFLITARDNTAVHKFQADLVAAKERAEEMVKLKDAFLANMSHEIRTPLTGILGFAQCLMEEAEDPHRELAGHIERSGHRLMNTLNSVLELAQLEAKSVQLKVDNVEITNEIKEAANLLSPLAHENVRLTVSVPDEPVHALVDRNAFGRVLNNLLSNALKFTQKGIVGVRAKVEQDKVRIEVHDSGVGISAEFIPQLFTEFKQESEGISRTHEGNGLGLAITKQLTELMNGRIAVESIQGLGSIFTVEFPLAERIQTDTPHAVDDSADRPAISGVAGQHNLLVVEDNHETRLLLEKLLQPHYQVISASDRDEVLKAARVSSFDGILMDINLGGSDDGVQIMRELREMPMFRDIPVIAVTAYAMPGDRQRFIEEGFEEYLSKPFHNDRLLAVLKEQLGAVRKQTTHQNGVRGNRNGSVAMNFE